MGMSGLEQRDLYDLIRKLLEVDPAQRITAHEALRHPFFLNTKP
jgi:serine/threonine protein kinase